MHFKSLLAAAALAISGSVAAEAATYPTFVLDTAASSIDVTQGSGCKFMSCATLTGTFGSGADAFSWTPGSATDTTYVSDFFNWAVSGFGAESFNVLVTLAFSSPDAASSTGSGSGTFATLLGVISGGKLHWSSVDSVTFAQGSTLDIDFDDVHAFGFGHKTKSGATFAGNTVVPVAPVPLPASIPLLGAGLLGLGMLARRKKSA